MIIAIKNVNSMYARAALRQLKLPMVQIKTNKVTEPVTYDYVISASEIFDIAYAEKENEVKIFARYHGDYTEATLNMSDFEYIVTYEGDLFTRKEG